MQESYGSDGLHPVEDLAPSLKRKDRRDSVAFLKGVINLDSRNRRREILGALSSDRVKSA